MSKQNNFLTKYFKKDRVKGVNQSLTESNMERNGENDEGETNSLKC